MEKKTVYLAVFKTGHEDCVWEHAWFFDTEEEMRKTMETIPENTFALLQATVLAKGHTWYDWIEECSISRIVVEYEESQPASP